MKVLKQIHDGENIMSVDIEFSREFLVLISEPVSAGSANASNASVVYKEKSMSVVYKEKDNDLWLRDDNGRRIRDEDEWGFGGHFRR